MNASTVVSKTGQKDQYLKNTRMATGRENIEMQLEVKEDIKIENVTEFTYLGSLLT